MERAAFVMRVKQGAQTEYLEAHRAGAIWPRIVDACRNAGMTNYSGWIGADEDRQVFAYFEAENLALSLDRLSKDPANAEWQEHMAPMMERDRHASTGDGLPLLRPAFYLP